MILARVIYYLTIGMGLALTILAGGSGNPFLILCALIFLFVATLKTTATPIIVGVLHGSFSLQMFLFTGICARGRWVDFAMLLTASAVLASLSVSYFAYKPLRLLFTGNGSPATACTRLPKI